MARSASELPRGPNDIYNAMRYARQEKGIEVSSNERSKKTEKIVGGKNATLNNVWILLKRAKREEDE